MVSDSADSGGRIYMDSESFLASLDQPPTAPKRLCVHCAEPTPGPACRLCTNCKRVYDKARRSKSGASGGRAVGGHLPSKHDGMMILMTCGARVWEWALPLATRVLCYRCKQVQKQKKAPQA